MALGQSDIKRLIAYSSVSHLGFCMLGVFAINRLGMQGGVLQMVNHGLSTGGLFAVVGMIYERYHTRKIADLGGLAHRTPLLATMMVILTLSSIGLPGLNGFVGEFLLLLGMFQRGWGEAPAEWAGQFRLISVLAVAGVVLGAWYMLALVQKVFFGPLREPHVGRDSISSPPGRAPAGPRPLAAGAGGLGAPGGVHLLDRDPAASVPGPHGPDARPVDRAGHAAARGQGSGLRVQGSGVRGQGFRGQGQGSGVPRPCPADREVTGPTRPGSESRTVNPEPYSLAPRPWPLTPSRRANAC